MSKDLKKKEEQPRDMTVPAAVYGRPGVQPKNIEAYLDYAEKNVDVNGKPSRVAAKWSQGKCPIPGTNDRVYSYLVVPVQKVAQWVEKCNAIPVNSANHPDIPPQYIASDGRCYHGENFECVVLYCSRKNWQDLMDEECRKAGFGSSKLGKLDDENPLGAGLERVPAGK